jgi:hypothetical protein
MDGTSRPAALQSCEQRSEDFPCLIFHFSFVIEIQKTRISLANPGLHHIAGQQVRSPPGLVSNEK